MADPKLLLLAAELDSERARVSRVIAELRAALPLLEARPDEQLAMYGAASLLDGFYTGIERSLARIARHFGIMPAGSGWHRELLDAASVDVPGLRPPVLSSAALAAVDPFLAFRHRFRNLYPFELDGERVRQLVASAPAAWVKTEVDLAQFADTLRALANTI